MDVSLPFAKHALNKSIATAISQALFKFATQNKNEFNNHMIPVELESLICEYAYCDGYTFIEQFGKYYTCTMHSSEKQFTNNKDKKLCQMIKFDASFNVWCQRLSTITTFLSTGEESPFQCSLHGYFEMISVNKVRIHWDPKLDNNNNNNKNVNDWQRSKLTMNIIFPFYENLTHSSGRSFKKSKFLKSKVVPEYKQRVQQLDDYKSTLQKDIDELFDFKLFQDDNKWTDEWIPDEDAFDWYYKQFKRCCNMYGCKKLQQSNYVKTIPFFGKWEIIKTDKNVNVYFEDNITHAIKSNGDDQDSVTLSIATQNDINKMVYEYNNGLAEEIEFQFEHRTFGRGKNFDADSEWYKNWIG